MIDNTKKTDTSATDNDTMGSIAGNILATFAEDREAEAVEEAVEAPKLARFADLECDGEEAVEAPEAEAPEAVEAPKLAPPALSALESARLNFQVELLPLEFPLHVIPARSSWTEAPNAGEYRACTRMDTGRIFGITGPDYGFVQPSELAALVDAAAPAGTEIKVRSSAFGDHLWFECGLPFGEFTVTPQIQQDANSRGWVHTDPRDGAGNTPVTAKLIFKHTYGGKGSYDVGLLLEALVCQNGMKVELTEGGKAIKIRHTVNFESRVQDLKRAFEAAGGMVNALSGMLQGLAETPITMPQFDAYCEALFPGESTQAKNKRKRLAEINASAVGCAPGTAWGALQAATYYATHETSVRVTGRSLSRYTLDDPSQLNGAQIEAIQGQARLESMTYGDSGAFTGKAFQYVSQNFA